jgi:hypothetical protein
MKLVEKKVKAGKTETVVQPEEDAPAGAEIIDLSELLARSLKGGKRTPAQAAAKPAAKSAAKSDRQKVAAKKTSPRASPPPRDSRGVQPWMTCSRSTRPSAILPSPPSLPKEAPRPKVCWRS